MLPHCGCADGIDLHIRVKRWYTCLTPYINGIQLRLNTCMHKIRQDPQIKFKIKNDSQHTIVYCLSYYLYRRKGISAYLHMHIRVESTRMTIWWHRPIHMVWYPSEILPKMLFHFIHLSIYCVLWRLTCMSGVASMCSYCKKGQNVYFLYYIPFSRDTATVITTAIKYVRTVQWMTNQLAPSKLGWV